MEVSEAVAVAVVAVEEAVVDAEAAVEVAVEAAVEDSDVCILLLFSISVILFPSFCSVLSGSFFAHFPFLT